MNFAFEDVMFLSGGAFFREHPYSPRPDYVGRKYSEIFRLEFYWLNYLKKMQEKIFVKDDLQKT